MQTINQLMLGNAIAVQNALVPVEGPKALPLTLDFTSDLFQLLDYSNMQQRGALGMVQTIFVDLSDTDEKLTVRMQGGQAIVIKGRTQGYYQLVCPNPLRIMFLCSGPVANVPVILLNFPALSGQWSTQ